MRFPNRFLTFGLMLGSLTLFAQDGSILQRAGRALDEGRTGEAITCLRDALIPMVAAHAPDESTFAIRIALSTAYLDAHELHEAEEILVQASRGDKVPTKGVSKAELDNNWGSLHLKQGRYDQARTEFEDALRQAGTSPEGTALVPEVLNNLAAVDIHEGDYRGALSAQRNALERWRDLIPEDHPNVIKGYANLATAQFFCGDPAAAHSSVAIAIASARRTYGSDSPELADLLVDDALILRRLKRNHEAKLAETEARKIGGTKTADPAIYTFDAKARRQ